MRWLRAIFDQRSLNEAQSQLAFSRRNVILGGAQLSIGAVLATRMTYISVFENQRYSLLAESNRVNLSLIPPRRGWIVDRAGKPMALNRTVFRVDVIPDRLKDTDTTLDSLQSMLGLTDDERDRIERDIDKAAGFQPVQITENLDWEKFAALSIRAPDMPGVVPAQGFARYYPDGAAVGHLLGYVGAASAADYEKSKDPLLIAPGFKVGKDAIEKTMEPLLRGKPGARRSEVTARGKLVRDLATRPDVVGNTLHLTIDAGLQAYAARRLGTNSGSAVVIDCMSGDLLAMVSMPSYDPNSFSDGIGQHEWKALSGNDHVPLMNKVLQGLYPPGSTVKPMNGLALLAAGVSPTDRIVCSGSLRVGNGIFHCHKRRGHGPLDLENAIKYSCDIYFYEMVRRLSYDRVAPVARMVGLGQKFDLPYPSQRYGTVPDSAWKRSKYKQDWTVADSLNASIGQGYVLANPLQLAVMAARIASGARAGAENLPRPEQRRSRAPAGVGRASRPHPGRYGRGRQRRRYRRGGAHPAAGHYAGSQDRHRAGKAHHHGRARARRAGQRVAAFQTARSCAVRVFRAGRKPALCRGNRARTWWATRCATSTRPSPVATS